LQNINNLFGVELTPDSDQLRESLAETLVPRQQQDEKNRGENEVEELSVVLVKLANVECSHSKTGVSYVSVNSEKSQTAINQL
jgi:hypothetical protein